MQRSILHVSDILSWADEHLKRAGRFPTADSGVVKGKWNEKWANIDQALARGCVDSLVARHCPNCWRSDETIATASDCRNTPSPTFLNGRIPTIVVAGSGQRQNPVRFRTPLVKHGSRSRSRSITASAAWPAVRRWHDCLPNGGECGTRTQLRSCRSIASCNGQTPTRPGRETGPLWKMGRFRRVVEKLGPQSITRYVEAVVACVAAQPWRNCYWIGAV